MSQLSESSEPVTCAGVPGRVIPGRMVDPAGLAPVLIQITARIENLYEDGTEIVRIETTHVPAPPTGAEELAEWADDHLRDPLTGTGRPQGEAAYFLAITASEDPSLIGKTFEWGL